MSAATVVFVCADTVGERMAGPAIRSVELAAVVAAAGHRAVLIAPGCSALDREGIELRTWTDATSLRIGLSGADVIVVFAPVLADHLWMAALGIPLVVDAYDPGLLETLEQRRGEPFNAQRTWVLDYLWAGLPVVCTHGDVLAELVQQRGLGIVVPPDDPAAVAAALRTLASEPASESAARRVRIADLAAEMTWERVAAPLVQFCAAPMQAPDRRVVVDGEERLVERLRRALRIARGRG